MARRSRRASDSAASGADVYAAISEAADPDWDNFDKVFPDAQGYLTFSRVGFDPEAYPGPGDILQRLPVQRSEGQPKDTQDRLFQQKETEPGSSSVYRAA